MKVAGSFASSGSQPQVYGLPVCDLDWNGALDLVSERAGGLEGYTFLSFLTREKAKRSKVEPVYREILESCMLLPQGKAMNAALRKQNGKVFPAGADELSFVMALLTYMATPRRIGVVGDNPAQVGETLAKLRAHAPWHDFVMMHKSMPCAKVDVLLAGMLGENQEEWLHSNVSRETARVVVAVGPLFKILSSELSGMPEIFRKLHMTWLYSLCAEPWHIALGKH